MADSRFIALLRGINVGGQNKIPMPELRAACAELGWSGVQSYIQSGNLVFQAAAAQGSELEAALERAIEGRFGLSITVIVRAASAWPAYVRDNPYPAENPKHVMLALSKESLRPEAAQELQARAAHGERLLRVGDALWIHYPDPTGVARSKLTPALFNRLAGSPVTARNWSTVLKLRELACQPC